MSCHNVFNDFGCVYCRRVGNWIGKCISRNYINYCNDIFVAPAWQQFSQKVDFYENFRSEILFCDLEYFWSDACVFYALILNAYFTITDPVSDVCCS